MNTLLLMLLAIAVLAICGQTYRLALYQELQAHYKEQYSGAERNVSELLQLGRWNQARINVLQAAINSIDAKQQVLSGHPKLTAKKLRRILQAHLKRQYVSNRTAYSRRIRTRSAAIMHNLYSLREDYRETHANKAATPYPGLLPDVMRSRFAQMRSFNKITTPLFYFTHDSL